jgi:hypothetical protein
MTTSDTEVTVCAKCKHLGRGYGVVPPEPDGRPGPLRGRCRSGDAICLLHLKGHTPINPVTGYGGEQMGAFCEDINKGACPEFERAPWWTLLRRGEL